MHRQTFCCEAGSIDGCSDFIFVVVGLDLQVLHALDERCIGSFVAGDAGEVNHFYGIGGLFGLFCLGEGSRRRLFWKI